MPFCYLVFAPFHLILLAFPRSLEACPWCMEEERGALSHAAQDRVLPLAHVTYSLCLSLLICRMGKIILLTRHGVVMRVQ